MDEKIYLFHVSYIYPEIELLEKFRLLFAIATCLLYIVLDNSKQFRVNFRRVSLPNLVTNYNLNYKKNEKHEETSCEDPQKYKNVRIDDDFAVNRLGSM